MLKSNNYFSSFTLRYLCKNNMNGMPIISVKIKTQGWVCITCYTKWKGVGKITVWMNGKENRRIIYLACCGNVTIVLAYYGKKAIVFTHNMGLCFWSYSSMLHGLRYCTWLTYTVQWPVYCVNPALYNVVCTPIKFKRLFFQVEDWILTEH